MQSYYMQQKRPVTETLQALDSVELEMGLEPATG
jgi:hypothetical protein